MANTQELSTEERPALLIRRLVSVGAGDIKHLYRGSCPDQVDGRRAGIAGTASSAVGATSTVVLCTEAEMERVFTDKIVMAKKHYRCDASEQWRRAGYTVTDCETAEQRLMVDAAEADKWRILPGQAYRKVTGIHEGDFCTYRARPGMDNVCNALDLFDE